MSHPRETPIGSFGEQCGLAVLGAGLAVDL
jgi:hypothetical protein